MSRNLALIGNPNCGKTTLFNLLTGSNQYVGNWAGVTVEKKAGKLKNTDYNIFRKTIFKNNKASFVMELPPYRRPLLKSVLKNTWDKTKGFIVKAGTVILSLSVLIWILQNFSPSLKFAENSSESIFAALGSVIAPFLKPLGFGTWQAAVSLLSGIAAKEAVVSTMSMLYSTDSTAALTTIISEVFTPVSACSFMVFSLLYMPCISAFACLLYTSDAADD